MSSLFQFPELRFERTRITMFRTPHPRRDHDQVASIAETFGVKGRVQEAGSCLVVRDRGSTLEIFQTSDSLWWTRLSRARSVVERPVALPEEGEAVALALAFVREKGLSDERADVKSVTYTECSRADRGREETALMRTALHVNFGFLLDGLPVMGPGAKMRVSFGSRKRIIEAYKFWREPVEDRVMEIITPDAAINLLREDQAFANLREGEARVVFHGARLGYYALPAPEMQGFLIPVYAFEGTASTPVLERYEFTKRVVAVEMSLEEAKRIGATFRLTRTVF